MSNVRTIHERATYDNRYGLDGWWLSLWAKWHVLRAQQRLIWAQADYESGWGTLGDDPKVDKTAMSKLRELETIFTEWEPRTIMGIQQLNEIGIDVVASREDDSKAAMAEGPVLAYLRSIRSALSKCTAEKPLSEYKPA